MKTNFYTQNPRDIFKADFLPWEKLKNKKIFITGGTGLIGRSLISSLILASKELNLGLQILALVRDAENAKERFGEAQKEIEIIGGSVERFLDMPQVDYVIHGASQTNSSEMVNHPVETIRTSIVGTLNMLEGARRNKVESFIYLSSMEVYGFPPKGKKISENDIGCFNPLNLRNCYPISKIMCENMCRAYTSEYEVPAKIVRLTQTIGSGAGKNDNRIFAYIERCIREKSNIVLNTTGETERSYISVIDAVTGILNVLLKGKNGMAYNVADEDTYCSIAQMAEHMAKENGIDVEYNLQSLCDNRYPQTIYMDLDTTLIKTLGWKPLL